MPIIPSYRLLLFILALTIIGPRESLAQSPGPVPLAEYWSLSRGDNFTTATVQGARDAEQAQYSFTRYHGWIYGSWEPNIFSRPLKLFYHDQREDNFTTATQEGENSARAAGYRFVRVEGYVSPVGGPGLTELKLFYSRTRQDDFTTASPVGERAALGAGYHFVRVEGYVRTETPKDSLQVWWHPGRQDYYTTALGIDVAIATGYRFVRSLGQIDGRPVPLDGSTHELITYWHPTRQEHWTTAALSEQLTAVREGYQLVRVEGYVKITGNARWQLLSYWSDQNQDHLTTVGSSPDSNYTLRFMQGYSLPLVYR